MKSTIMCKDAHHNCTLWQETLPADGVIVLLLIRVLFTSESCESMFVLSVLGLHEADLKRNPCILPAYEKIHFINALRILQCL